MPTETIEQMSRASTIEGPVTGSPIADGDGTPLARDAGSKPAST